MWSTLRRLLPLARAASGSSSSSSLRAAAAACGRACGRASGLSSAASAAPPGPEDAANKRLLGPRNPPVKFAQYTERSLDESLRYLDSAAYKEVYGDRPVWFHYRRNLRNSFPASKPRKRCFDSQGVYIRANPCPLCRDEYLVVDYRHSALLVQFLDPESGLLFDNDRLSLCKHQYVKLQLEAEKAFDAGYLEAAVPFRYYDYALYCGQRRLSEDPFGQYAGGTGLPHAQELVIEPPLVDIRRPEMPNRYAMEVSMQLRLRKKYKGKPVRPGFSPPVDDYLDKQISD